MPLGKVSGQHHEHLQAAPDDGLGVRDARNRLHRQCVPGLGDPRRPGLHAGRSLRADERAVQQLVGLADRLHAGVGGHCDPALPAAVGDRYRVLLGVDQGVRAESGLDERGRHHPDGHRCESAGLVPVLDRGRRADRELRHDQHRRVPPYPQRSRSSSAGTASTRTTPSPSTPESPTPAPTAPSSSPISPHSPCSSTDRSGRSPIRTCTPSPTRSPRATPRSSTTA